MAKCDICGKGVTFGIKVSHSHRRSISLGLGLLLTAGLSRLTSGVLSIHITPFFLGSTLLLLLFTLAVSAAVPVVRILGIHPAEAIG